jgi:hypothetical protein
LISLDPSEKSKRVNDSLIPHIAFRDSLGDQCLRFYFYFTVYDEQDWGQQVEVLITPHNDVDEQFSLGNLTHDDMKNNKWEYRDITFNSTFSNYTVRNCSIKNTY